MSTCVICYKRLTRSSCNDIVSDRCIDCCHVPQGDDNDHKVSKECIHCDDRASKPLNSTLESSIIFVDNQGIDIRDYIRTG